MNQIRTIHWPHNERNGVSNHQHLNCLLNRLFRHKSKKHQSSTSLVFVRGIHQWLVDSPHKGPVMRKIFPFDNVIMSQPCSYRYCHVISMTLERVNMEMWYKFCDQTKQVSLAGWYLSTIRVTQVAEHWNLKSNILSNQRVSQMGVPLAACREPVGIQNKPPNGLYAFEHKT